MRCSRCGTENRPDRKFCSECAAPLATTCPSCGAANQPGEKFCGECATPLGLAAVATPSDREPSTSRGGGAGVGADGGSTGGPGRPAEAAVAERRLVSILFADLVGFTSLADGRDAEETRELLSRYFEAAQQVVGRYGGTVEKFIGDAVMAVWGAPTAHEDDAERAVRAALDLVDAVAALGSPGAGPLQARAAVLTGEAAVTIGATNQGMVAGDLVNTASRLQSVAVPGTVLVNEGTFRAASGAIAFEPVGAQALKGKEAPVPAWRAVRIVAMVGGAGRTDQLEPPFVGRDGQLRLLKEVLHATARERRARLVSVVGAAGIGKSRFAWEFHKYIDGISEAIYWHQGRSPAYGEGITFWALGEMIRKRAGLAESDDHATTRERIAATVAEYVPDLEERRWIEPRLLQLLGVEEIRPSEREELFAAWRTFFERVADLGPTILLFEDVHWADPGLFDFIDHILEWSRSHPILIVTMARPELLERRPDWGAGRRNFVSIELEPLPDEAMVAGLEGLVPGLPRSTVETILERAEGVPLYAVEIVRMLLQEGRIAAADGSYRPVGDLTDVQVPESLHALIAARLDTLEPAERGLLQDGSVLGQSFTQAAIAAVAGATEESLAPLLRALVRREMLSLNADPRSPERGQYAFVHRLIREVAYGTLARRDRRTRHLAAARHFESLGDDELAGVLATHYLDAFRASPEGPEGDAVAIQARIALRAAADRAAALHSYEQALAYLEHALTVTTEPADRATILERAGVAAQASARFDAAARYFREAIDLYRGAGDRPAAARTAAALGLMFALTGDVRPAIELIAPALDEFADLEADPSFIALVSAAARAYVLHDENARAVELADRALVAAERLDLVAVIADAVMTKGVALAYVGRSREAAILMSGVLGLAEEYGLVTAELRSHLNMSQFLFADDPRSGLLSARAGLERARKLGFGEWAILLAGNASASAVPVGDWDWVLAAAEDLGDDVVASAVETYGWAVVVRALRGDPAAGASGLREVERMVGASSDPQNDAYAALMRAWVAYAADDFSQTLAESRDPFVDVTVTYRIYVLAGHAALALRDPDRARRAIADLDSIGVNGRWAATSRAVIQAGILALEDRVPEALNAYGEVFRSWRALDLPFELALAELEMSELVGPTRREVRPAIDEARAIATRLDARLVLRRLDRLDGVVAGEERAGGDGAAGAANGATGGAQRSSGTEVVANP